MIPAVAQRRHELQKLCHLYGVQRLSLFGSAASGRHSRGESDLDFLVEFNSTAVAGYADAYFGLLEALEQLFGTSVDLVVESAIRNPYFLESAERTRTPIYEA